MPRKYRPWIAAGVGLLVAVIIGIAVAVALEDDGAPGVETNAVQRIRARNLKLQALVVELLRSRPGTVEAASRSRAGDQPHRAMGDGCDPNYAGACLNPSASDYDCEDGSGNGPEYIGEVSVVGVDHFGLDRNGNGIGCEVE